MAGSVTLELKGRRLDDKLPELLQTASRSANEVADPFLPPGYLKAKAVFDVSGVARGGEDGGDRRLDAQADEVLVIELKDRSTLITSAARLRESLAIAEPELVREDGTILFEKLREQASASRGLLGDAAGGLVSKVFSLTVGAVEDDILKAANKKRKELEALAGAGAAPQAGAAGSGLSWLATKALMWAIEDRLQSDPGRLLNWAAAPGSAGRPEPLDATAATALADAALPNDRKPVLVFVHGTASSTLGSFGDLLSGDRGVWSALQRRYSGGIYAFEHHTLSASPIDNALRLAQALPQGAQISLVSHSRGGLVADLLCLDAFDAQIANYRADVPHSGDADRDESKRVMEQLDAAHEDQRHQLRQLAALLREKKFVIERYVRVASPARGTRLASGNFDVFLSGLLTLIGQVPFFFGSPAYAAFKRVVIEIARNRTNAHLVPGIEAMLPDSPMARLLRDAPAKAGIQMAVIAGDIEGGNLLKRLGVLLSDLLLFDNIDNDLVVDTAAMLCGIAPQVQARVLFDRGAEVSHFRYFSNIDTRSALRDWLVADEPVKLAAFLPMPGRFEELDAQTEELRLSAIGKRRGTAAAELPVVVVVPGVMGSHLWVNRSDRVWFDPLDIAEGGLDKIKWGEPNVEAEKLFSMFYGKLAEHLATSHRVERFAYDWRQPLDVLADRFGEFLDRLLKQTQQPIRLLAHSMGGLVVRACIYRRRAIMDALMARNGARFVMLGTPNQGAHSMVENLLGKGRTLRSLVRLDLKHDMQAVLDIVAGFRGPLQLLPKPGFVDTFQGQDGGGAPGIEYGRAETWSAFKPKLRDFWFGDGLCAAPPQDVLDAASWLWQQDGTATPALPESYRDKTVYVYGIAPNTPCGVREEAGRLKMVGTTRGDGTVTWDSGQIEYIGRYYYLPAEHGALPSSEAHFPALADLLTSGSTAQLPSNPPAVRATEAARPLTYDAGPPTVDDGDALARG